MQAAQYNFHSCLMDKENSIHLIFTDQEGILFSVMYLDGVLYDGLIDLFDRKREDNQSHKFHWGFIHESWTSMGFIPHSIVFDFLDTNLFSTITFLQTVADNKKIYITNFLPIGDAVTVSHFLQVPIYFTLRAEAIVEKHNIVDLKKYIMDVAKRRNYEKRD
jgi:hypothetical protein